MIAKTAKAWAVLSAGGLAWGAQVVASAPKAITSAEWLGGIGVLVATIACYLTTNAPAAPAPAPTPVAP
jgi:hypothetical protein